MGFLASVHAQGRGTPPLHADWPKVSGKARQSELYEYSWGGDHLASVGLAYPAGMLDNAVLRLDSVTCGWHVA